MRRGLTFFAAYERVTGKLRSARPEIDIPGHVSSVRDSDGTSGRGVTLTASGYRLPRFSPWYINRHSDVYLSRSTGTHMVHN